MKMLFGFGTYAGFRGSIEHHQLMMTNVFSGRYPATFEDTDLAGIPFIGIKEIGNSDKTHKVSVHNSYTRDTKNIFRFPVIHGDRSNFGASIQRYLKKIEPGTPRFYPRVAFPSYLKQLRQKGMPDVRYYKAQFLGKQTITKRFKEGAAILGLSNPEYFKPQSLRGVCITRMVNDGSVSMAETMQYSRHRSVSASKSYQRTDGLSEGNRLRAIGVNTKSSTSNNQPNHQKWKLKEEGEQQPIVESGADKAITMEEMTEANLLRQEFYENQKTPEVELEVCSGQESTPQANIGFMTQCGISELEGNMEDLRAEMAANAVAKKNRETTPSLVSPNQPESTNSKIVKDLIHQVKELSAELKQRIEEELVFDSRENDFARDEQMTKMQIWSLRTELKGTQKENKALKRENAELFASISRSNDSELGYGGSARKRSREYDSEESSDDDDFVRNTKRKSSYKKRRK